MPLKLKSVEESGARHWNVMPCRKGRPGEDTHEARVSGKGAKFPQGWGFKLQGPAVQFCVRSRLDALLASARLACCWRGVGTRLANTPGQNDE